MDGQPAVVVAVSKKLRYLTILPYAWVAGRCSCVFWVAHAGSLQIWIWHGVWLEGRGVVGY